MKLGDKIYGVPVGALLVAALWWYVSSRKKGGEEPWSALRSAVRARQARKGTGIDLGGGDTY